jgi:hypothetical protein
MAKKAPKLLEWVKVKCVVEGHNEGERAVLVMAGGHGEMTV